MAFGYEFVTLDTKQKHDRRVLLEYYPLIAQASVLPVLVLFQLGYLILWLARRGVREPGSPSLNKSSKGNLSVFKIVRRVINTVRWWMRKPVMKSWDCGSRSQWIYGGIWTVWLLYLCVVRTGNDYLHLTKRFGIIGASQLPFQYLLSMRSPYSPVQYLTRMSHEQLKPAHEVLGRIVYLLFVLHAAFYMNFFVLSGFLAKRIKDRDVIFGIISLILFSAMITTALNRIRRWNYRVFYNFHVVIANLLIVALFFHVSHIRLYVFQIIAVNSIHQILRSIKFKIYTGSVRVLPGTDLVQVRVSLSPTNEAMKWKPGQHVYLSRPSGYVNTDGALDNLLMRNKQNPFTIASLPSTDKQLMLITKGLRGNTKDLVELARKVESEDVHEVSLALEGPYGSSARLPDFSLFDKVLLVAGGVGATFILPIYQSIVADMEAGRSIKVRFIWSVRTLAETQWAFPAHGGEEGNSGQAHSNQDVEVYVTRTSGSSSNTNLRNSVAGDGDGDNIELSENDQLLTLEEQIEKLPHGLDVQIGRPGLAGIVDETFRNGNRVAILCCGPKSLSETLSKSVERWSRKGYEVYWHNESFSW